jgi:hypothetical protein
MMTLRDNERMIARCVDYEFEDVICDIDDVDLLSPQRQRWYSFQNRIVRALIWRNVSPAVALNPGLKKLQLKRAYDLFVFVCMNPWDLLYLNSIQGWREGCRIAVCWIDEIWSSELKRLKPHLKILSKFDLIVVNCSGSMSVMQKEIRRPCCHLPPGIDAIQFCPYPNPPPRSIDVYSIGRRSDISHKAFLRLAEQRKIFYIYDTLQSSYMFPTNPKQHRQLLANMAKRSRYFIVNTPKIDRPDTTQGQNEIGFRFFEGAAAGTVMIGQSPNSQAFKKHFDWPDAVIPMEFNEPDVGRILNKLDSDSERIAAIRKNSVVQSLMRHDWVYRWRAILENAGLEPRPALVEREQRLKQLSEIVQNANIQLSPHTANIVMG